MECSENGYEGKARARLIMIEPIQRPRTATTLITQ